MKNLVALFAVALLTASTAFGQKTESPLNQDRVFKQTLAAIRYPKTDNWVGKGAMVYVNFIIDETGKVTTVNLLKEGALDGLYAQEINRFMQELTKQTFAQAGEYVLPIVFEAQEKTESYQLTEDDLKAHTRTFIQLTQTRSVLNEVYVAATSR